MSDYDFKQLSPHDFEVLCRDILQEEEGVRLESFKTGRDEGIDFRYAIGGKQTIGAFAGDVIVQAKHYVGTGWNGLHSSLKKEVSKAQALKPSRYILVTSVGLTPVNKVTIQKLFGSILSTSDIFGADDLNNLLERHEKVHRRHFKLWLASKTVLDRVLHNADVIQSEFEVERVYEQVQKYVSSSAYHRAIEILEKDRVVIISGQPGVGKTTLAKILMYRYLEKEFDAVSILTDFYSGRSLFQKGKKQIFYFDDFMGATFLGESGAAITRNEDKAILDFIEMVNKTPTARLILTTREHILQQALTISEKLKHSDIAAHKCVLEIGDYSLKQKGEILYNHLYFSELPNEYKEALLDNEHYMSIVHHEKFNPRLIEWLSSYQRVKKVAPEADGYATFAFNLLENPAEIWQHAYEYQISDAARSVLLTLRSFDGSTFVDILHDAFNELHACRSASYGFTRKPEDWKKALQELNNSFIKPGMVKPFGPTIGAINPSVIDALNGVLTDTVENYMDLVKGCLFFKQFEHLWAFATSDDNQRLMATIKAKKETFISCISKLSDRPVNVEIEGSTYPFLDVVPEARITTLLNVYSVFPEPELEEVIADNLQQLFQSWRDLIEINTSSVALLLLTLGTSGEQFREAYNECLSAVLEAISWGMPSSDFLEVLQCIDVSGLSFDQFEKLEDGLSAYSSDYFSDELSDCRMTNDIDALIGSLDEISELLDIDTSDLKAECDVKREEVEEEEEAYYSHMEDEAKEQWRYEREMERQNEGMLREMFGTLRDNN